MTDRCCNVVDSIDCAAPPGHPNEAKDLVTCFGCGDDACRSCSSIVAYRWKGQRRRVRMCFTCQEQRQKEIGITTSPELRRIARNRAQGAG